jgi:hypothetical protein
VQQLILARRQEGGSNAAIHVELCTLSQALKLAQSLGYQVSPLDITDLKRTNAVKPLKRRVRYLSLEEEQRLLTELNPKRRVAPDKVSMAQDVYDPWSCSGHRCRHSEITTSNGRMSISIGAPSAFTEARSRMKRSSSSPSVPGKSCRGERRRRRASMSSPTGIRVDLGNTPRWRSRKPVNGPAYRR